MSRTSGLVFSLLTAAALAPLLLPAAAGRADDEADAGRPHFSDHVTLPSSEDLESKLEAAPDYVKAGDWPRAAEVLQWVLDHPEDAFVPVRRPAPEGKETVGWVSARAEANRLIAALPRKGQELYELRHGPKAAELLAAARKRGDVAQVARIASRYRHTRAGRQAADLLGTHHLDRGRYAAAGYYFRRLLRGPEADRLAPLTLFKASLALHRAGDETASAEAWKVLAARAPRGLSLGGREVPLAELKKALFRPPAAGAWDAAAREWTVFRGSAGRAARAAGPVAALRGGWERGTLDSRPVSEWVQGALGRLKERNEAALPAFFPLHAAGKVIYRSQRGLHAVEPATGEVLWESLLLQGSLEALADDPAILAHVGGWAAALLPSFPHVLIENSVIGALSADARQVYAVEDLAIPPVPQNQNAYEDQGGSGLRFTHADGLTQAVYHSRLLAFDLDSGRAVWEAGGRGDKERPLHDAHFLGPPLPLGGKLYVLAEKDSAVRLACLDPADGRLHWAQTLAVAKKNVLIDGARRTWAAHPAHAEGVLVCPTNAGAVVAVDLAERGLLWAHAYRKDPPPPPAAPVMRGRFRRGLAVATPRPLDLKVKWRLCAPVIAQGRVLVAAPDGSVLDCLDLRTGALLWRVPRQEEDLYLGGVFGDRVLVVGRRHCGALSLRSGEVLWGLETAEPSGQGVAAGQSYYLPVRVSPKTGAPAVQVLDVERGALAREIALPGGDLPGNLVLSGGRVISQTATRVAAYPCGADGQGGAQ